MTTSRWRCSEKSDNKACWSREERIGVRFSKARSLDARAERALRRASYSRTCSACACNGSPALGRIGGFAVAMATTGLSVGWAWRLLVAARLMMNPRRLLGQE